MVESIGRLDPCGSIALMSVNACELSYKPFDSEAFTKGLSDLGFYEIHSIDESGVQAFAAWNDDMLLVCFRGTDSTADWLADLMSNKVDFTDRTVIRKVGVEVHTGFIRTLRVIENEMNRVVETHLPGRKLVVCGHSLGAAMAVLYAMRFHAHDVSAVVTFGCPRVGNEAFADEFNSIHAAHSLRYVRNNDVVARVPWKFMGYAHVWRQQYIDRWGKLHENLKASRFWKMYDATAGRVHRLCKFKFLAGIEDHSIHDYRRLLEKACGRMGTSV